MKYRELKARWKYLLGQDCSIATNIIPPANIEDDAFRLGMDGVLTARAGYAWDGPSGPMMDTPTAMRASLFHDLLFQMLRRGLLDYDTAKPKADELFRRICIADGMSHFRAWYAYRAVRRFGRPTKPEKGDTPEWIVLPEPEVA